MLKLFQHCIIYCLQGQIQFTVIKSLSDVHFTTIICCVIEKCLKIRTASFEEVNWCLGVTFLSFSLHVYYLTTWLNVHPQFFLITVKFRYKLEKESKQQTGKPVMKKDSALTVISVVKKSKCFIKYPRHQPQQ